MKIKDFIASISVEELNADDLFEVDPDVNVDEGELISNAVETTATEITEAMDITASLEAYASFIDSVSKRGGITTGEYVAVTIGINHINKKLGVPGIAISNEAFGDKLGSATQGLKDTVLKHAKRAGEYANKASIRILELLRRFYGWLVSMVKASKAKATALYRTVTNSKINEVTYKTNLSSDLNLSKVDMFNAEVITNIEKVIQVVNTVSKDFTDIISQTELKLKALSSTIKNEEAGDKSEAAKAESAEICEYLVERFTECGYLKASNAGKQLKLTSRVLVNVEVLRFNAADGIEYPEFTMERIGTPSNEVEFKITRGDFISYLKALQSLNSYTEHAGMNFKKFDTVISKLYELDGFGRAHRRVLVVLEEHYGRIATLVKIMNTTSRISNSLIDHSIKVADLFEETTVDMVS